MLHHLEQIACSAEKFMMQKQLSDVAKSIHYSTAHLKLISLPRH